MISQSGMAWPDPFIHTSKRPAPLCAAEHTPGFGERAPGFIPRGDKNSPARCVRYRAEFRSPARKNGLFFPPTESTPMRYRAILPAALSILAGLALLGSAQAQAPRKPVA